jgi:hypothetical protein
VTDRKLPIAVALTVGALALSACHVGPNGEVGGRGDNRICTPFTTAASTTSSIPGAPGSAPALDSASVVDDCLHRWGYILARSHDPADLVGRATVAACASTLSTWNQQTLGQPGADDALSLTTGQPMSPIGAHADFAQSRALFYVVQARAGNCAPPPATKSATGRTTP